MTRPRPLSFDRVRVVLDADAGQLRRPELRRHPMAPRFVLTLPGRAEAEAPAHRAAPGPGQPMADARAPDPSALPAAVVGAARPDDGEAPPAGAATDAPAAREAQEAQEANEAHEAPDAPQAARWQPDAAGAPPHRPHAAVAQGPPPAAPLPAQAVPVSAIARAVEDATAVRALAAVIVDTCSGDDKRDTGPWSFALPLVEQGFGASRLDLRLSRESLSLRFECDGPRTRELLCRHTASLKAQLDEQIRPPLEVDIAVCEL